MFMRSIIRHDKYIRKVVDEAHKEAGKNRAPEADFETGHKVKSESDHQAVDDEYEETHGEENEREREELDERFDDGVDQREDEPSGDGERKGDFWVVGGEPFDGEIHANAIGKPTDNKML